MERRASILIVDDDRMVRLMLRRILEGYGYLCAEASQVDPARALLSEAAFDLVITDMNMPGDSGMDLIRTISDRHSDTAVIMVTGDDDPALAELAVEEGTYGYLIKPFGGNQLRVMVLNALRRRELEIQQRARTEDLERRVEERTAELDSSREETIERLSMAAELRDDATGEHIRRMSDCSGVLARRSGLDAEQVETIRLASLMHDVGKIGIPDAILLKPGPLTDQEFEVMKRHAEIGHRMLAGSQSQLLRVASIIALTHHERFDGAGYPQHLAGSSIPVEGRIAAIADVFDALISDRVYRPAFEVSAAVGMMREGRGTQFDPELFDLFFDALDDVLSLRSTPGFA